MNIITHVHVYRAGSVWCYAAYDSAGFDHSDSLGISADADPLAEAAEQFPEAQIVRIPDVTADGGPMEVCSMSTFTHIYREDGNGYPADGDEVLVPDRCGDRHRLMRVLESSRIHTRQWESNYIYVRLGDSDRNWDDLHYDEAQSAWDDLHHVEPIVEDTVPAEED